MNERTNEWTDGRTSRQQDIYGAQIGTRKFDSSYLAKIVKVRAHREQSRAEQKGGVGC